MGEKILARNLLYELWNQVEKYRKHGNTLEFDFNLNTTSFKEWYNRHQVCNPFNLFRKFLFSKIKI